MAYSDDRWLAKELDDFNLFWQLRQKVSKLLDDAHKAGYEEGYEEGRKAEANDACKHMEVV